ncbi:MAG: dihydroorotate dehydrogenase electron transfer subunit [Candidatus Omnitrophota bacterium]|nr:dihydroorotate dehydrogenase electron transfer subunit [Candidatus Omnitrophota bacterium]
MPKIKSKVKSQKSKVISNRNIKDNYFEIIIEAPEIAKSAQPGQFVNIKVSDGIEPLLRRPLSIHRISYQPPAISRQQRIKNSIVLLYEAVGKGTEILSQRRPGEFLDVIGPSGNGFNIDRRPLTVDYRPILIAGGMGTAPLVFLAEKLREVKSKKAPAKAGSRQILSNGREKGKMLVLIGARTRKDILCEEEFKNLGCEVKISTDDGSRGFKGYVSDLLAKELSAFSYQPSAIYACGPKLLLKEISRISCERNIPAQLSLESHMACGIGVCMGCVIKVKSKNAKGKTDDKYSRVCKEGPVFVANQILWE